MNRKKFSFFTLVLIIAVMLIVLSLGTSVAISLFCVEPTPIQLTLFHTCIDGWKMGIAAIVGLIGGRSELPK